MAKRFTSTEKWSDPWFRKLSPRLKCLWDWMFTQCDIAGSIDPDWGLASFQIGEECNASDVQAFGDRVSTLPSGRLLLKCFIEFQYGELTQSCRSHVSVIAICHRLSIPIVTPIQRGKDMYSLGSSLSSLTLKEKGNTAKIADVVPDEPKLKPELPAWCRAAAEGLKVLILKTGSSAKITEAQIKEWSSDFDKINRLDGRSVDDIRLMVKNIFADDFWSKNIRSAGKLRLRWNEGKLDRLLPPDEEDYGPEQGDML